MDIGVPPFLLNATLRGIIAQRLLRTLCPHCKTQTPTPKTAWNEFAKPDKLKMPAKVFEPKGCEECRHTGYLGRAGIYEILTPDTVVREKITANANLDELKALVKNNGMRTLKIGGAQKVADGLTTLEEVYSVIPQHDY